MSTIRLNCTLPSKLRSDAKQLRTPRCFVRMLVRAAVLRRGRAASALLAMVVAAAVATAMMNLYVDVQAKLRTEFRNYGANVVVVAKGWPSVAGDALAEIESALGPKTLAVPFAYAVARTTDGQSVVVVGTDFDRVRQLDQLVDGDRLAKPSAQRALWSACAQLPWSVQAAAEPPAFRLSVSKGRRSTLTPAGTAADRRR